MSRFRHSVRSCATGADRGTTWTTKLVMFRLSQYLRGLVMANRPECPYCGEVSDRVSGRAIYPHRADLSHKVFYQCAPCDAYVGCHPHTETALGRLADAELRLEKRKTHAVFDVLWKSGNMSRSQAYKWLCEKLGIGSQECHIGMFSVAMCKRAQRACQEYTAANLNPWT